MTQGMSQREVVAERRTATSAQWPQVSMFSGAASHRSWWKPALCQPPFPDLPDPWGDAMLVYFRPSGSLAGQIGSCGGWGGGGEFTWPMDHPKLCGIHLGVCWHLHPTLLLCTRPVSLSAGNGPCLGFRKPKQPYQWLSYQEVSDRGQAPLCLSSQAWLAGPLLGPRGLCFPCRACLPHSWQQRMWLPATAWGVGEVSQPVAILSGGLPSLLKTFWFLISSPHLYAGRQQG